MVVFLLAPAAAVLLTREPRIAVDGQRLPRRTAAHRRRRRRARPCGSSAAATTASWRSTPATSSRRPKSTRPGSSPLRLAVGEGSVWTANAGDDTRHAASIRSCPAAGARIQLGSRGRRRRGQLRGHVGDATARPGTVTRIDPIANRVLGEPVRTGSFPTALTVGAGFVWVVNAGDGTVARIDPREDVVIGRRLPVGRDPQDIAVGHGSVWVANRGDGTVTRLSAADGRRQGAPIARRRRARRARDHPRRRARARHASAATCGRSPPGPAAYSIVSQRRRLPDVARGRRRERLGRRRAQRDRDAPAQQPRDRAAARRGAGGAAPAQRIEAETLRPGTVVRDGRRERRPGARPVAERTARTGQRTAYTHPRPGPALRWRAQVQRPASAGRGGALALRGRVQPPRATVTLRRGRCPLRVDRLDVLWAPAADGDLAVAAERAARPLGAGRGLRPRPLRHARRARSPTCTPVAPAWSATSAPGRASGTVRIRSRMSAAGQDARGLAGRALARRPRARRLGPSSSAGSTSARARASTASRPTTSTATPTTSASRCARPTSCASTASSRAPRMRAGSRSGSRTTSIRRPRWRADFDWALVEQCFEYRRVRAAAAVHGGGQGGVRRSSTQLAPGAFCPAARAAGFMAMRKPLELDAAREPCW